MDDFDTSEILDDQDYMNSDLYTSTILERNNSAESSDSSHSNELITKVENYIVPDFYTIYNTNNKNKNSNLLICSNFFGTDSETEIQKFSKTKLLFEIFILIFINIITFQPFRNFLEILVNVFTIDSVYSSLYFYLNFLGFQIKMTTSYIDRCICYGIFYFLFSIISFVSFNNLQEPLRYFILLVTIPSFIEIISNNNYYKKISTPIKKSYDELIKKIVCKQMTKIINSIIKNVIKLDLKIHYTDLTPYYDTVNFPATCKQFVTAFIIANIFNYLDKGGLKFPLVIYKNIYMKDQYSKIRNDKEYITAIIKNRQWDHLVDIYTLNRLIRLCVSDDNSKDYMSKKVDEIIRTILFNINRIFTCWTLLSISNSIIFALIGFFLFLHKEDKKIRYLVNILIFILVSFVTKEQLLLIFLCEIGIHFAKSSLVDDLFNSLKKLFVS